MFFNFQGIPKMVSKRIYTKKNLITHAKFIIKQTWQHGFIFSCLNFNTHNLIYLKASCITSSGHCPLSAAWFFKSDAFFLSLTCTSDRMNPCMGSLTHPMSVKWKQTTLRFLTSCHNSYRSPSVTSNTLRVFQFTQSACGMPNGSCLLPA